MNFRPVVLLFEKVSMCSQSQKGLYLGQSIVNYHMLVSFVQ